ncbi:MAG TPA: alpha/beta hydrolase [Gemmataceae bacterium]|jgi:pimeloyl-ACP methyl ester carboxylesterase|nr:alpha/beta hydrolase [Gemmataceae bacterium]
MRRIPSPAGVTVSYESYGSGPPLVLVHGGFSDHRTNWEFVAPAFAQRFAVHAVARRGRGETTATEGHRLEDEARDVAAVVRAIGEPVFLLGHSYGAQAALVAAAEVPDRVRALVLYEPAWPRVIGPAALARLEALARAGDWDGFAVTFFRDQLFVPAGELDALRSTPLWPPIVADARPSLGDLRALSRYDFRADRFRGLRVPVTLQVGTESPRHLYVTDALAAALPDVRVQELPGQAHEGMTTAPEMYAEAVSRALLP